MFLSQNVSILPQIQVRKPSNLLTKFFIHINILCPYFCIGSC